MSSVEGPSSDSVVSGELEPSASWLGAVVYLLVAEKTAHRHLVILICATSHDVVHVRSGDQRTHGGSVVVVKVNPSYSSHPKWFGVGAALISFLPCSHNMSHAGWWKDPLLI